MGRRRNRLVRSGNRALCLTDTHVRHVTLEGQRERVEAIPLASIQATEFRVVTDKSLLLIGYLLSAIAGLFLGLGLWAGELMGVLLFTGAFLGLLASGFSIYKFYTNLIGRLTIRYPGGQLELRSGSEPIELLEAFTHTLEASQRQVLRRGGQPGHAGPTDPA